MLVKHDIDRFESFADKAVVLTIDILHSIIRGSDPIGYKLIARSYCGALFLREGCF